MVKKKARLRENDPLESKTDSILSSFSENKQVNKVESQELNTLASQEVKKPIKTTSKLKKATYKLSEEVIERLDRYHLKLNLDRGKKNTPYKEVLVEEAISFYLDQLEEQPDLLDQALIRQENR
jgi:hypothetical protein